MFSTTTTCSFPVELKWDHSHDDDTIRNKDAIQSCPNLPAGVVQLHRKLESCYVQLPWPSMFDRVGIYTQVGEGRGDVAAASKVIRVMQKMCPQLNFVWFIDHFAYKPEDYLQGCDLSKMTFLTHHRFPPKSGIQPLTFLVDGPLTSGATDYILNRGFRTTLKGPRFNFIENSYIPNLRRVVDGALKVIQQNTSSEPHQIYPHLHQYLFQNSADDDRGVVMGLQKGSGVFLDESRLQASSSLSRKGCCPSYLLEIEDKGLRTDLWEAFGIKETEIPDDERHSVPLDSFTYEIVSDPSNIFNIKIISAHKEKDPDSVLNETEAFDDSSAIKKEKEIPNYDRYSLNSGYAHRSSSWGKFIDVVAVHERGKNVIIVLNQTEAFDTKAKGRMNFKELSTSQFVEKILHADRLAFLKKWGYGQVCVKGINDTNFVTVQQSAADNERTMTLVLRPSFLPHDMKCFQLASERLLATGDNTAAEDWAARCILYLYEDVANGFKNRFLKQQVELASTVSSNLSKLLHSFGKANVPFSSEEMTEVEGILQSSSLADETLQFCHLITENFSFLKVLEGGLKRAAWQYCIPELMEIEAEGMDAEFKDGLIAFWKDFEASDCVFHLQNLPQIAEKIQMKVEAWLGEKPSLNHD